MALFSRIIRRVHKNGTGRVLIVENRPGRLPEYYRHLNVLCHNTAAHILPVQMQFAGFGVSHDGQRQAVYVCSCIWCRRRQGWARHAVTGKPFRLWAHQ